MAKEKTMAEQKQAVYEITEMKQKQTVLDLKTNEDAEIVVITKKIVWKAEVTAEQKIRVLHELVSPVEKRVEALEKFFASESYNASKNDALSKGDFLTQALKSKLVQRLQMNPVFEEMGAREIYNRWLKGFQEKKPGAIKVLAEAKAAMEETALDF